MREIPSAPDSAVVVGDFPGIDPGALFELWTAEHRLVEWWPETASLDLKVGGSYRLEWPSMGWILTGEYTSIVPGCHLGFTWNWSHEPDKRTRQVDVYLKEVDGGSLMAIYHREFGDDDTEVADRQGIVEGWIHFGMRLLGQMQVAEGVES